MKKTIAAAVLAAMMATSAQASDLSTAHKKVRECYFQTGHSSVAAAKQHRNRIGGNTAVWLPDGKSIYLDMPNGFIPSVMSKTSVKTISKKKSRYVVSVKKKGYAVFKKGGKRIIVSAKTLCTSKLCHGYITATNLIGEPKKDRLHHPDRLRTEITKVGTTSTGIKVQWKPVPLADYYRVMCKPYDPGEIGIPAYKVVVDTPMAVVPKQSHKISIAPTHEGAFERLWRTNCETD